MREKADDLGLRGTQQVRRSYKTEDDRISGVTAPEAIVRGVPGSSVVTLESVTVTYGKNAALRDVTASFPAGAVGLLGTNGAGMSTMIKALLGFLVPTRGRMRVLGLDVADVPLEIRARIGYMPESDGHIPGMNAVSFVAYCGELAGLPRVDAMQRAHGCCSTSGSAKPAIATSRPIPPA